MSRAERKLAHRLDAEVFADARLALDNDPRVPATVHVHVDNGTATLTGTVRAAAERLAAEQIVGRIEGVQRLADLITVFDTSDPEGFEPPDR
jgi:osmotically-inducible protein OsmY